MTRLQSELHRLYLPRSQAHSEDDARSSALIDPSGCVRAMVMTLTRPPSWELLSKVWRGVQADLGLPAPAIAVSGIDGLQLWFSLAEPITAEKAHAFLDALRARFLPDVDARRFKLMPAVDALDLHPQRHAALVPAQHEPTGNWSAFVAADLAPVFADTPWLDIPPSEEGQATLLRSLGTVPPAVFEAAWTQLGLSGDAPISNPASEPTLKPAPQRAAQAAAQPQAGSTAADDDAKRFLLRVMNDDSVPLALRVEAAKALLQHSNNPRPAPGG